MYRPVANVILVFNKEGNPVAGSALQHEQKKSSSLERTVSYLKEELTYAAEAVNHRMLFAYEGDLIIIFLEVTKESTSDWVNHFLDLVEQRLHHLFPSVMFSWGIGKQKEDAGDLSRTFKKAKAALDMGRM